MNIETVNEIITSLGSAGELSIKETKVMALAKAYKQLAAENVSMRKILGEVIYSSEEVEHDGYLTFVVSPDSVHDAADLLEGETPTTDRIVAGIKAEAKSHDLNAFISHYSAELDTHIANGGDQFDERSVRLRGVIVGARMFREKLRDEEKVQALREGAK